MNTTKPSQELDAERAALASVISDLSALQTAIKEAKQTRQERDLAWRQLVNSLESKIPPTGGKAN